MEKPQFNINIGDAPLHPCSCGSYFFKTSVVLKKLSQFESPTGREEKVPLDIIICEKCGKVPTFVAERIKGIPEEFCDTKKIILDGE
jgi:hypothetical protein